MEDGSSAASCRGGLRGAKELGEKTAWLLSQHHRGDRAVQSAAVVTDRWNKPNAQPRSGFAASAASRIGGRVEKSLALSGLQN